MNRAERGDFFFSVQVFTLRVLGLASCRMAGHKKAPQGVNLARLVGVEGGGLNAVVFFYCCSENLGVVRFEACYQVGHGLGCCGFICSKL